MEASILNKFLLALAKTKDALLLDLKNEFVSIRKIAEGGFDDCDSASDGLVAVETVINSVFDRIGVDISNYEETKELVDAVEAVFKLTDGLAEDIQKISDDPSDVGNIASTVIDRVKEVIAIIESFKDIEYGKIKEEFKDTPYEDIAKTLGRRLLDHILITLLRNMRGAFDDEIEMCRILARNIKADISAITSEITGAAKALLKDAEDRAHELVGRLGDEMDEIKKNVEELGEEAATSNIYMKASRTLSCIYAVLDFLGLMGTATIEIKIPKKVTDAIKTATNFLDSGLKDLGPILDIIGLSPTTFDNFQKQLTSAGDAAASFSYPLTIDIINWNSLKTLFTDPLSYLKKMYHVDSYSEATELLTKIMALVRVFNPDVPDFASIKNMLITLVRKIEDRILTAAKETANELWKKMEPFVMFIKMMIDLLEQVADKLKDGVQDLLNEFRSMLAMLGKEIDGAYNQIQLTGEELAKYAKENVQKAGDMAEDAWNQINDSAAEAYTEFKKEFGKIGLNKYLCFDSEAVKDIVQAYASDLSEEAGKQISEAEISACVDSIKDWFDSTKTEVINFVNPNEWFKRFDTVAGELEKVFKEDVSAVTSLISANGVKKLAGNFKGTLKDTFSKLDISDYIKVITTAIDEVAIPDPESYFNNFTSIVKNCFASVGNVDVSTLWTSTKRKLLTPLIDYLKDLVINALSVLMNQFLTNMLAEHGEEIKALVNFKNLVTDMTKVADEAAHGNPSSAIALVSDSLTETGETIAVEINSSLGEYKEYISWISWTIIEIINLSTKSPSLGDILKFLKNFYSKIPKVIKDEFFDLFPSMPSNGFTDYVQSISYTLDVDSRFFCATLLNLKGEEKGDISKGTLSAILQICIFVGDYKTGNKNEDGTDEKIPAVFFIPVISTKGELVFELGNNLLTLQLSADINKVVQEAVGEPNVEFKLDFTDEAKALPATGGEALPEEIPDTDDDDDLDPLDEEDFADGETFDNCELEGYDHIGQSDVDMLGVLLSDLAASLADGESMLDFYRAQSGNPDATREEMENEIKKWEEQRNGK